MTADPAEPIDGVTHHPRGAPSGAVLLTHGAGGDRDMPLLVALCDEWVRRGWLAIRYNLPYRRRRAKGLPSGAGAGDRAGIVEAIGVARGLAGGPLIVGGHSYGGRQTSMVIADDPPTAAIVDLLALTSYPLHPPGKSERARTQHLPAIRVPTVFVLGDRDPFGSPAELCAAASLITAPTEVVTVAGARHDLKTPRCEVTAFAVEAALRLLQSG